MTLDAFEELLHTLYDKGYRLISLDDYVNNRISTRPVIYHCLYL